MLNLKELSERYKDVGLGYIHFGGHSYYEINSDIPLSLNSFGGTTGFILNDKGEVELWEFVDASCTYYKNGEEISEDEWHNTEESEDVQLDIRSDNTRKWWGKTLDNYFPHEWYPDRKIVAFELIGNLPFNRKGVIEKVVGEGENSWIELISPEGAYDFTVSDCLQCPEFFKPLYTK